MKSIKITTCSILFIIIFAFSVSGAKNFIWVRLYSGDVKLYPEGKNKMVTPKIGMAVKRKDVIKTGPNSWVTLAFENSSIIKIAPNSEVKVDKIKYDLEERIMKTKIDIFGVGKLFAAVRKLKKKSRFKIGTPTAVVGVRGTEFMVDVPDKNTAIFAVFKGKVIVKDFVSEQGLSTDDMEMMMDFLHEIDLGGNKYSTYKKGKGFESAHDIGDKFQNEKRITRELKEDSSKLKKELEKESREERWEKSEQLRAQALK